jgi:hypothetical protein
MRQQLRIPGFTFLSLLALSLTSQSLAAQAATGRIVGRVVEAEQGAAIAGAVIEVVGTTLQTQSGIDGRYTLNDVPAGVVSIRARYIGYGPKIVAGVEVVAGAGTTQDIGLTVQVVELEEITVAAVAEQGTVNRALEEQRYAQNVVSAITQEQIGKSPDSDAGQAVQRVSGVTVQDGKYVFVRGLGERYTTTSLNGARVPSPEPEKKLVPLDLFPSGLLEGITTSKTFTPDQPGDFAGASVNLKTREFPARRTLTISTSAGINSAATGRTVVKAPTVGGEWLGLNNSRRDLPDAARPFYRAVSINGATQSDINAIVAGFRNTWSLERGTGSPNGSFGISLGGEDPIAGQSIGYLASLSYSTNQEIRQNERRAVINPGTTPGSFDPQNEYAGETGRQAVLWGGILNLSTRIGSHSKISLSNTLTRSADNEATHLVGFNDGFALTLDQTRLTYTLRQARSHQLAGQHLFGTRHLVDWSASVAKVDRTEPDRSDLAYIAAIDSGTGNLTPIEWFGAPRSAIRSFGDLNERSTEGSASYTLSLGTSSNPIQVKVGGAARRTSRDALNVPFDILGGSLAQAERAADPETIFDGTYASQGRLGLTINSLSGRYDAEDRLYAGFAMLDYPLTSGLRVVAGARVEDSRIEINTLSPETGTLPVETVLATTDLLPALAFNLSLTDNQTLRLSGTQTLSRPEYRELSPSGYLAEPIGGKRIRGNQNLERALVQNLDARWEWYPRAGEAISVAAFYKHFERPIERVLIQTSDGNAPDVTFQNARAADNYGVELEVRKRLDHLGLAPLTVFANATLMKSKIKVDTTDGSSLTNENRAMVGQSPYVVNAGVEWQAPKGISVTALYNVVGRRIYEAGINPLPDAYEEARHLVDVSVRVPLLQTLTVKADAKNLLNEPYRITQGGLDQLYYLTGRSFSFGATWTP